MNQKERLAAIRELYPTHDALKRRVRELEAALSADLKKTQIELDQALKLLRELRDAVKKENVLTTRQYVGLALAISHLLDGSPASGGSEHG